MLPRVRGQLKPCQLDRYRCGTKCIPLKWICDGYNDCDDNLDERNCLLANQNATTGKLTSAKIQEAGNILDGSPSVSTSPGCSSKMFSCDKGDKCLKMSSLCDTLRDCSDGSDEVNCPAKSSGCEVSKFSCDSGAKCLPMTWLCDSIDDCIDRKDEHNCPVTKGVSVAQAAEAAAMTAAQEAKRAAFAAQEMMKSAKEAADKAKRARQIAEAVETS
ncbi:low-density lipoprotein receptor 2-like isoform X2 [Actinia tenebrosa]|uniref:Low-density lipoprotein receptor 2-like isoform X2 n=1 Tax=Actinia tenebrosa TaxID=6105 RepID=A0A6P8IQU0_ACTTE|nr:low-density lipoprotein receptor 2-like isoform X2 [Actinia tenebrosa]